MWKITIRSFKNFDKDIPKKFNILSIALSKKTTLDSHEKHAEKTNWGRVSMIRGSKNY
tara:strand:- start:505 stop:678 length:174 start_codon:yes stop_codon:yes gene_type:complete